MTDIVFQGSEGQPLTNSVLVAEKFDKRHCDIIKKIKGLLNDSPQKCGQFFVSSTYTDSSGKENLMYIMNRDGFTLLAMGFTGQKALQFKLDYIDAFNKMEPNHPEYPFPSFVRRYLHVETVGGSHTNNGSANQPYAGRTEQTARYATVAACQCDSGRTAYLSPPTEVLYGEADGKRVAH